ncbi:hypothetical protein SAMN02910369_02020 [Lachnospiraceae bacterium NE2001]|nr:hypothetical protein SAMN02910369_02020 [Lachnospiraceae bacterium NE2001]
MKTTGKKLLTYIQADKDREENILKYQQLLGTAFNNYSTIKLSMNLFTLYERIADLLDTQSPDDDMMQVRDEMEEYINTLSFSLRTVFVDKKPEDTLIADINSIRDKITDDMKLLTFYVDAYEIYEYILNRKEPKFREDDLTEIDTEELADSMFNFVFAEDDKLLINTRIQDLVAQLPVRMTKNHFFDIISNSLMIYRGGEKKSVDGFIESIRDAALLDEPAGITDRYASLYDFYKELKDQNYESIDKETIDKLNEKISENADKISSICSDYMMMTEVINDILVVLYTEGMKDNSYLDNKYDTASDIISSIVTATDIYEASAGFDSLFVKLEGAQEDAYENLASLNSGLDDLYNTYYEMYENEGIKANFDKLIKVDRLTSTSLFMDLEDNGLSVVVDEADDIYINEEKSLLIEDLTAHFGKLGRSERRSIMAKVMSLMPVFFNTKQEIKEYFEYALSSCSDLAELTACKELIDDLIIYDSRD